MVKFYKIRRRSDFLYSAGGSHPVFCEVGQVWDELDRLKHHIFGQVYMESDAYDDCEVVTYVVNEHCATPVKHCLEAFDAVSREAKEELERRKKIADLGLVERIKRSRQTIQGNQ